MTYSSFSDTYGPVVCGNFNGNGVLLDYTGNYVEEEYPPGVLVAMAAPPTQVGISQSYEDSYTSYGEEYGGSASETNSVGFSVSSRVSFEVSGIDYDWAAGAGGSYSWAKEFEKTNTKTKTVTVATFAVGGALDNSIIYFLVTFKSYNYTIIDHPYEDSLVGTYLCISIPDPPQAYLGSQEYFNLMYANPPIGSETFTHTVGHPDTYPQEVDVGSYASDYYQSPSERAVGQGDKFEQIEITMTELKSFGFEYTKSSNWAYGFRMLGIEFEGGSGEFNSFGYEYGANEACIFEGRVGQILDFDEATTYSYKWGMFIYHTTHPDAGNTYLIINYYVEDATPYYPTPPPSTTPPSTTESPTDTTSGAGISGGAIGVVVVVIGSIVLVKRKWAKKTGSKKIR